MNMPQALYVARKVLAKIARNEYVDEVEIEKEFGVSHAQIVNALPIIESLETVEAARLG